LGLFRFSEIAQTGLTIGTYPQNQFDVNIIADTGAKAVMCIMTQDEFRQRGINWD
jgi:hypothetical protein